MSKFYEYGLALRPVSCSTVPAGFVEFGNHPDWPHGTVLYTSPLRRDDVEHFDLVPLDPNDPINLRRRFDTFRDEVYDNFVENDSYLHGSMLLTWSARPDCEFQITFLGEDGTPTGHVCFDDFDDAVKELW